MNIEKGRYKNVAREKRACKWCKIALGTETIEDENHVLYKCDFYTALRQRLKSTISKITNTVITHVDYMALLNSHHSDTSTNSIARNQDEKLLPQIARTVAKFITHCLTRAKKLTMNTTLASSASS